MTTHIAIVRAQYDYNQKQVLWLTSMSPIELMAFQFDMGLDWLTRYTGDDRGRLLELLKQPLIWKWWLNEWNRRDDERLLPALYNIQSGDRLAQYRAFHQEVFITHTPPFTLLENSYSKVIGQLIEFKIQEQ